MINEGFKNPTTKDDITALEDWLTTRLTGSPPGEGAHASLTHSHAHATASLLTFPRLCIPILGTRAISPPSVLSHTHKTAGSADR